MWRRLFPLLLVGPIVYASPLKPHPVYDFSKGLDTYHSSLSLPDGFVHNSLNVFFDSQAPVTKRQGYTVSFTTSPFPSQTEWNYTDSTNTSWIIVRSSGSIIANSVSGATSVLVSTVSVNNSVGEANVFGNAYFVDQTQGVYYWNGSTTVYVAGSPKGSLMAQWHGRLWVAGLAVPNGNVLDGSKQYDGTVWATGLNPNDPVSLVVGLADNFDNISAIYPFLDTLYTFKHFQTYAMYGFDQTNFQISFITQECGCIDQQSIQTFGAALKFVSERGVENFDGYTCTRISDPVKNLVDNAIQAQGGSNSLSWSQSNPSDWAAGTISNLDTTTLSPAIALISTSTLENFSSLVNWNILVPSWSVSGGTVTASTTTFSGGRMKMQQASSQNLNSGIDVKINFQISVTGPGTSNKIGVVNGSNQGYSAFIQGLAGQWSFEAGPFNQATDNVTPLINVNTGTNDTNFHSVEMVRSLAGSTSFYFDGSLMGNFTDNTYSLASTQEVYLEAFTQTQAITHSFGGLVMQNAQSTGTFKSQVHAVGSISTWGNFSISDVLNSGNIVFSICSANNSGMASSTCASQTANSQITVATNTFVQWYSTFTNTAASQEPTINSVAVQWFSGNRTAPMSSTVWDNRYWLSLTTTTSDTGNDGVLVLSSKGSWSLLDIHAGGFVQYKNALYHSDSLSSGNTYLDNQGYNDNGAAINAFIQSKDFCEEGPTQDDYYESLYPSADNLGNYNMGISYIMDRDATSPYSLSSINQSEFQNNTSIKIPFVLNSTNQNFGKCINFTFTESDLGSPWNFYGWTAYYHERQVQ